MTVEAATSGSLTPLNRVQPVDPTFVLDWTATVTGDASGGTADVRCNFGINNAFVMVFAGAQGSDVATFDMSWQIATGAFTQTVELNVLGTQAGLLIDGNITHNIDMFKAARTMLIPGPGRQGAFVVRQDNPGVGETWSGHGRAYIWPRNQVLGLPCRVFWPYLM